MSLINDNPGKPTCNSCGSDSVTCNGEYYTTGGDLEHVEFTHSCQSCGHIESTIHQGTYGYDHEYMCSLPHKQAEEDLYEDERALPVIISDITLEVKRYL